MSENTKIEWCDHTFNPWEGCQKVGPGCDHCYAEARNARFAGGMAANWGPGAPRRRTSPANWRKPLAWEEAHAEFFAAHGRRQRVFCASLADVFDNAVPDAWRADLIDLIWNTPHLDWLLLTKRIGNAGSMITRALELAGRGVNTPWPWSNVWLGATIVNQEEADRDIPKLLSAPARMRFLSMEPLLGPVTLNPWLLAEHGRRHIGAHPGIGWVIAGGESGPGARPMHPDWARSLRDQCSAADVAFHFKQHGEWAPGSGDFGAGRFETAAIAHDGRVAHGGHRIDDYPRGSASSDGWAMVHRAGKRAAGRHLDGRTHDEFPEV
ncbi:phage Gp37/Gp68 family protein [Burkholderia seminalis]|uniref:phage Gp37/Gp68 family protein n=1 Tax=Burkholderia seminalis TaxID=488731 RepID=UPI00084F4F7E|nr:phage Gp37/Gp68 family protein [Burkholderia seminalis]